MVKHAWSVLCDRIVIDKDTNNLVLSTVEQIKFTHSEKDTKRTIIANISGHLVSLWYKDSKDSSKLVNFKIEMKNFRGKTIGGQEGVVEFGDGLHARTISSFDRLPLPSSGQGHYVFVVKMKANGGWKKVADVPILIEVVQKEAADQT